MQKGIENALKRVGADYEVFYYIFKDWDNDKEFVEVFENKLSGSNFDIVFSVNFSPLISDVCSQKNIKYISWVYDAPINIRRTDTLKNACNEIYFFDRIQAQEYINQGVSGAHHMPLAVDTELFLKSAASESAAKDYSCDVSLLGQLYQSDFTYLCGPLDGYTRGYLDGLVRTQMHLKNQGCYILKEMITDELMSELNKFYLKASKNTFTVKNKELEYALACEATGRDRFTALALLQNRCRVNLYSNDKDERLKKVKNMGYVDYYTQMPKVFRKSRINLNISLSIIQSGIPLRVLDVLGSGGFLITNYQPEIAEIFEDGVDLVIYHDMKDLVQKVQYYLANDDARKEIAHNGYNKVKEYFTFDDRIHRIGLV